MIEAGSTGPVQAVQVQEVPAQAWAVGTDGRVGRGVVGAGVASRLTAGVALGVDAGIWRRGAAGAGATVGRVPLVVGTGA